MFNFLSSKRFPFYIIAIAIALGVSFYFLPTTGVKATTDPNTPEEGYWSLTCDGSTVVAKTYIFHTVGQDFDQGEACSNDVPGVAQERGVAQWKCSCSATIPPTPTPTPTPTPVPVSGWICMNSSTTLLKKLHYASEQEKNTGMQQCQTYIQTNNISGGTCTLSDTDCVAPTPTPTPAPVSGYVCMDSNGKPFKESKYSTVDEKSSFMQVCQSYIQTNNVPGGACRFSDTACNSSANPSPTPTNPQSPTQPKGGGNGNNGNPTSSTNPSGLVSCDGTVTIDATNQTAYSNCGFQQFLNLIGNIIGFLLKVAVSIAAVAFFFAGFLYLTAGGNPGKIEEAHQIFWSALIGIIIMLCAWLLVNTIIKGLVADPEFFKGIFG
ncbi:MAG: hypothetical protein PHV42_00115 [Candidatus Pacebacteria bacterium]|nr:hypothetical protein [Candidatus Paceibacterota bacterium]